MRKRKKIAVIYSQQNSYNLPFFNFFKSQISRNKVYKMSNLKTPTTPAERKRKQREREKYPEKRLKKLDSLYMFGEIDVSVVLDDENNVWFKGLDLARALEMKYPKESIALSIDKKYCKSFETLTLNLDKYHDIFNMQPKTTFVNETGMNLYVVRSNKPKAVEFAIWVCGEVLPSIRRTNKYEIDAKNNPYREMNEFLQMQLDESKCEINELKKENNDIQKSYNDLQNDFRTQMCKYNDALLTMKAYSVPKLKNKAKQEYFIIYTKYKPEDLSLEKFPYYACRVQLDCLEKRRNDLLMEFRDLKTLKKYLVPNSVAFYNLIWEEMGDYLEREDKRKLTKNSFRLKNITEEQMLEMIDNLYLTQHGILPDSDIEN